MESLEVESFERRPAPMTRGGDFNGEQGPLRRVLNRCSAAKVQRGCQSRAQIAAAVWMLVIVELGEP